MAWLPIVQALLPYVIELIEHLWDHRQGAGADKKAAAQAYIASVVPDADPAMTGRMIDAMVGLYNATSWSDDFGVKFSLAKKG